MNENWRDKEIVVMPHLKNPTETVSVKTKVYTSLGLAIKKILDDFDNIYGNIYEHSGLFIEELIKDIIVYGFDAGWLEEVNNSNIELRKRILVNGARFFGTSYAKDSSAIINIDNRIFMREAGRDDKILQAIVLHELRKKKKKQSETWTGNISKNIDGNEYKNILIEVDAFDIQFKFEEKSRKEINSDGTNQIRRRFKDIDRETNSSQLEKKNKKAWFLMDPSIYGIGYYHRDLINGIEATGDAMAGRNRTRNSN
jgi:hypothetical protein